MKLLCIYKQPPSSPFASVSKLLLNNHKAIFKNVSSFSLCCKVHALKEDSKQYEIDPEKAKEALKELDQKIQSISNKQVSSPPKLKVLDMKPTREGMISENGKLEISESFLALGAGALVLFTIFYNVLFITVIKPSIDGP
ncbi:uncharacterized protein LOC127084657 [Lathyrus oleraceus]|uniref:Uncharacterized protein n=1 Tax=Pisum sativum TaxID=3888 RepID=A0A9D4WTL2_PEA|nr:uncharacterized protein LOC127084657 [Pisum sativum]KAI5408868.1 hypothetical protein KIW84_054628 [Pisum sativum]